MTSLVDVLQRLHERATQDLNTPAVKEAEILERIDYVCRCLSNRAGVRLLMACLLAKLDNSRIDPRQPYTEIGGEQCFSGRTLDEQYIGSFIMRTTSPAIRRRHFLTPALRNIARPLTTDVTLVGRPAACTAIP